MNSHRMTVRSQIPFPSKRKSKWSFPLDGLKVGDVLMIESGAEETKKGLAAARGLVGRMKSANPEDAREFGVAKTDDGFGIWRLK